MAGDLQPEAASLGAWGGRWKRRYEPRKIEGKSRRERHWAPAPVGLRPPSAGAPNCCYTVLPPADFHN